HGVGSRLCAGARVEVVACAPGALQGLDLADEDAVHQGPSGIAGVLARRREAIAAAGLLARLEHGARIAHAFAIGDRVEPLVAGQLLDREELSHVKSPMEPGPAMPPAVNISFSRRAWCAAARSTSSGVSINDCSIISPSRQSSNSSCRMKLMERMVGASVIW